MNDSFIKELLGGPLDSPSDWKTGKWLLTLTVCLVIYFLNKFTEYIFLFLTTLVVKTNISMVGKVLSDSTEDSVIINRGEVDESQAYIPDESDILTTETETEEGEPLGSE